MLEEFTEICSSGRNLLLKTFKVQTIQQTEDQCQLLEQTGVWKLWNYQDFCIDQLQNPVWQKHSLTKLITHSYWIHRAITQSRLEKCYKLGACTVSLRRFLKLLIRLAQQLEGVFLHFSNKTVSFSFFWDVSSEQISSGQTTAAQLSQGQESDLANNKNNNSAVASFKLSSALGHRLLPCKCSWCHFEFIAPSTTGGCTGPRSKHSNLKPWRLG